MSIFSNGIELQNMNSNINQGLSFKKNKQKYNNLREGYAGIDAKSNKSGNKIDSLMQQYNEEVETYKKLYEAYLKEYKKGSSGQNLKNTVVKYRGMYYYVDNNNLARRFGDDKSQSWLRKDSSCPESSKDLTDEEFNKLRKMGSIPMGIGELCLTGGYNVRNEFTGQKAWIDPTGIKHAYNNFNEKHTSCPESYKTVKDRQWKASQDGKSWGENDKCETKLDNTTNDLFTKVKISNDKLINILNQIRDESKKIKREQEKYEEPIHNQRQKISDNNVELEKNKKILLKQVQNVYAIERNKKQFDLASDSLRIKYLTYGLGSVLLAIGIGGALMRN
tara:strand:- start:2772 stop:3773 length:1002 start_codon:yes stop_codon:yes gene_type:complete